MLFRSLDMAEKPEGLEKSRRVRHRPDFERAYGSGRRLAGRFMTVFVVANHTTTTRLGVAATGKLGSAVVRNRAKRLARELFRRRQQPAGLDIVIVPRLNMLDAPFTSVQSDFDSVLEQRNRPAGHRTSSAHHTSPRRTRGSSRV